MLNVYSSVFLLTYLNPQKVVPILTFGGFGAVFEFWEPRDTYTDAKFDGEFTSDVCFKFWESLIDEKL